MIRETIASALHSGLKDSNERETPIERVTAFAGAGRLGTLLWRLKYANDPRAFKPASLLIGKKLPRNLHGSTRITIAQRALKEWCLPMCTVCNGAKEVMRGEKLVECRTCQGTGKRRHSEHERALDGVMPRMQPLLLVAFQVIREHDVDTAVVTLQRLDRLR